MPMDRRRYPPDWPQISRRIRERDKWRCRWCGARNGEPHPDTGAKVVLTVAHIDNPDPMDCRDENLASLCQACHNRHDAPMRAAHARVTRAAKRGGQLPLPLEDAPAPVTAPPRRAPRKPRLSRCGGMILG